MEMTVARAGLFTTVQDLGRPGNRAAGVPVSGAADVFAARVANLLVGNSEDAAVLECTLIGPELRFEEEVVIAVAGAEFEGVEMWKPVAVRAGETLRLGRVRRGCRGYVAVRGGIDVAPILGSRSTCLRGRFGGVKGRALRDGDVVRIGGEAAGRSSVDRSTWFIDPRVLPVYPANPVVRVLPGAEADEFPRDWMEREFEVTAQADRMGVRLRGKPLVRESATELLSSGVAPGTVQVPPDGQPILLLADAQTIGGYPRLAHVVSVDLAQVAQLQAGDRIRFRAVTLEEAHQAWRERERTLALLREGLKAKLASPIS